MDVCEGEATQPTETALPQGAPGPGPERALLGWALVFGSRAASWRMCVGGGHAVRSAQGCVHLTSRVSLACCCWQVAARAPERTAESESSSCCRPFFRAVAISGTFPYQLISYGFSFWQTAYFNDSVDCVKKYSLCIWIIKYLLFAFRGWEVGRDSHLKLTYWFHSTEYIMWDN